MIIFFHVWKTTEMSWELLFPWKDSSSSSSLLLLALSAKTNRLKVMSLSVVTPSPLGNFSFKDSVFFPPLGGVGGHQVICVKNIKWQRKSIVEEKTHSEIHRLTLQRVTLYINIYLLFSIKYIHIYVAVPVRVSVSEWCLRMWRYFNVIVQTAVHHGTG